MAREIPNKLIFFLKTALEDMDDGYEYASELNRILNSDDCQLILSSKEIDALREYAEATKKVGELNHYTINRIKEIENDHFGSRGIPGFLKIDNSPPEKPIWPF